jgi:hypothetical protein
MKMKLFLLLFVATTVLITPPMSNAQVAVGVGISVHIGPPVLPVYVQPACPEPGFIWTPGYWAYGPDGYYWVPGAWVAPPAPNLLWTPGYWGWAGGVYVWHGGYWGPHVGFYGGINYGFGYTGVGFVGGYWRGGAFFYNRSVANINVTVIHNTYINNTVINRTVVNNVSFNGGRGGIVARPTALETRYAGEHHWQPTGPQSQHEQMARQNRALLASVNHGRPSIAATSRPGEFSGRGVVGARPVNANYRNNGNANHGNNGGPGHNNPSFNSNNAHNNGSFNNNHGSNNSGGGRNGGGQQHGQGEREHDRK